MEKIGIIGLGKLGLCFALQAESAGYPVVGVDKIPEYVEAINRKTLRSPEKGVDDYLSSAKALEATTDMEALIAGDISLIFIFVATPSAENGAYDHSQIDNAVETLAAFGPRLSETHLVVCCTTLPGYCDNLAGRVAPLGYSVSYKPEFIAQGTIMRDMQYPDMALIGTHNPRAEEKIRAIYGRIYKKKPEIHVMDRLSAEICKLATNCFLTTKISFANSIGDLAWRAGADPGKILAAIGGDTRIGPKYLAYGDGFGGPCFPRDNRALLHFSRLHDMFLHLSHSTDEVNRQHLEFQVGRYLKQYEPHDTIEFDWVTYKKESVSLEESQRLALCIRLAESGRKVLIRERPEVVDALRRKYGGLFTYETRYED